jgi:iron complex transport system permease protein
MPVSIVAGAMFLLAVDDLARVLLSVEIPLGIATSIIGTPFFLYLLLNTRKGWS